LYGLVIAIPALIIDGIIFSEFLKKIKAAPPEGIFKVKQSQQKDLPGFDISLFIALMPILLMGMNTVNDLLSHGNSFNRIIKLLVTQALPC
jgi:H+/gluconate symporter-like permease